jgi:hypothetical protein
LIFRVGHDALDDVGITLLVAQELADPAIPSADVGDEFPQAVDATVREGLDPLFGSVVDPNRPT